MSKDEQGFPKRPFVYDAQGDVTNMVYDTSGQQILPWPEASSDDDARDKGPISETVSATVPG